METAMDLSNDVHKTSLRPIGSEAEREHRAATSASPQVGAVRLPLQGLRPQLRLVTLVCLPVFAVLGLAKLFSSANGVPLRQLTQDATTVLDGHFYVGIISSIGIVLWAAAATLCLFSYAHLAHSEGSVLRPFLLASGLITALLLADDLFLIHDEIFPTYIGLPGEFFGLFYGAVMVVYLFVFRQLLLQSSYVILVAALVCFGLSVTVDVTYRALTGIFPQQHVLLVEDGAKLLGITLWTTFFAVVCAATLRVGNRPVKQ
jgi:hypothetical protein